MKRLPASLVLLLILVIEAFLSRAISGVGLHQALVVVGVVLFLGARWGGSSVTRWSGWTLGLLLALGGGLLLGSGTVPVTLSELPWAFHLAVGWHFGLWAATLGPRLRRGEATGKMPAFALVAGGVLAAGFVVWTVGHVEIYGTSVFAVRLGATVILGGSLWLAWRASADRLPVMGAPVAAIRGGQDRMAFRGTMPLLAVLVLAGVLAAGAWSIQGAERVALWCYAWLGRADDTTALQDFDEAAPMMVGGGGFDDEAMRQLPRRADLTLDDSIRFHLWFERSDQMQRALRRPIYLRTSTMGHFSGAGGLGPVRRGAWIYDSDDGTEDGITRLPGAGRDPNSDSVEYWTLVDQRQARELPLMPGTTALGLSGVYAFADDWYQLALEQHQERVRFRVHADTRPWRSVIGGSGLKKGDTDMDYLQLPNTVLTERLVRLAREAAPRDWPLERRLEALRGIVSGCRYSLSYDNPDDLEPVENFLFGERRGHCELFAASTAMLTRAIGVPSRVAFGFCGGEYHPSRRLVAFRQSDFHAWAEIHLAEHGWVIFDTTPDGAGAAGPAERNPDQRAFAAIDPNRFEDLGGERLLDRIELPWWTRATSVLIEEISRWFGVFCLAAILVAVASWVWRRRRLRVAGDSLGATRLGRVGRGKKESAGLIREFLQACAARGCVKGPGQTLAEFLETLRERGLANPDLDEMVAYFYRTSYAGVPPDPERERHYRESLRAFRLAEAQERGEG